MSFTIPARLTTELDAVNACLQAMGLKAATSIDPTDGAVAKCLQALNEADLDIQSKGLACNSDEAMTLQLDSDSNIPLPEQTLSVANAYFPSFNGGQACRVVSRAGKLYDIVNQTFTFTAPFQVDIIVRLAYEDLDQPARRYIAVLAAHRLQGKGQSSPTVTQITNQELRQVEALHEQNEDRVKPKNQISGNATVLGSLYASGVSRRVNWSY